jgi:uncharacterized damage-inducible protein DinB
MTSDHIRTLIDYHYWARDRILDAADQLAQAQYTQEIFSSFTSVRRTLNHTYFAEWAWYNRWQGNPPKAFPSWDEIPDAAELRRQWTALEKQVRDYVESVGEDGIERTYEYRLISGAEARSVFWEMILHVVNHASYHRGQVITMLRQLEAAPSKPMDMIAFFRERSR